MLVKEGLYSSDKATIIGDGGTIGVDLSKYDIEHKQDCKDEIITKIPNFEEQVCDLFCWSSW